MVTQTARHGHNRVAALERRGLSGFRPELHRIFRAMQPNGSIVADNGSDMYINGRFDTRWDNRVLNPAFRSLSATMSR